MNCPKCIGSLEPQSYGEQTLHRCNSCAGLWCKPDSLMYLHEEWMSEAVLDTGDPRVGQKLDSIGDIHCPEGHGPLTKTADEVQSHIWYEECVTCQGMFLDAGEFTDLKFKTVLDHVRILVKGQRR